MELLIPLVIGSVLLASPILALLAFVRVRALGLEFDRRSKLVDKRLKALDERVAILGVPVVGVTPVPTPEPGPAPEAPRRPETTAPPAPGQKPVPTREPQEPVVMQLPPVQPRRTLPSIEWERWLGIRGAAVLGGIALVLAGLLFFQHAIQQGWFGPQARIISGAALGAILMLFRGRMARVAHPLLADVLVGAGAVLQYGAAWSAMQVHHLVSMQVALPWMIVTTVAACFLALRHNSATIATFGLLGGFATPLLLGTTAEGPGLLAYLLLLNLGLIAVARKGRWTVLGPLALAATTLLQVRWLWAHATVETVGLGLLFVGGFALLFLLKPGAGDRVLDAASRLSALVVAGVLASVLALKSDLGLTLVGLGPLLGVLSVGACAVAWLRGERLLATVAAGADGILAVAWLMRQQNSGEPVQLWAWIGLMLGLAALFAVYGRLSPAREGLPLSERRETPFVFLALATLAGLAVLTVEVQVPLGPLTTTAAVLLGLAGWIMVDRGARVALPVLAAAIGGLFALRLVLATGPDPATSLESLPYVLGLGLGLLVLTWFQRSTVRFAPLAAAALLLPVILALSPPVPAGAVTYPLALLLLAVMATASTTASGAAWAHGLLVGAVVIAEQRWFSMTLGPAAIESAGPALAWAAGLVAVCTLGPLCAGRRIWRGTGTLGRTAILAPVVWLRPDVWRLRELALPDLATAALPFALAAVSTLALAVILLQRRSRPDDSSMGKAPTLAAAVTAGLLALGLARLAGPEWGIVTAALAGLAWTALGVKCAHENLRHAGTMTLIAAGLALLVTALAPGWYPRSEALVWNRISYSHLVPLGAIAGGMLLIRELRNVKEVVTTRTVLGVLVVLGIFAWINLAIVQATGEGASVIFELRRITSRDLGMSLAWILYSLVLLGLGTARRISGLRWMSLGITLLTVAKVFLYDLGNLRGLYRVGSLAGLAVCLLLVSFLYQRFVFGRLDADEPAE